MTAHSVEAEHDGRPVPHAEARRLVAQAVSGRVNRWQASLADPNHREASATRAELSRLRRLKADDPAVADAWDIVMPVVPPQLRPEGRRDADPTDAERAVHAALVLYAIHSQSSREPRHQRDRRFGLAVGLLAADERAGEGARSRFTAFATAGSWSQRIYHLRGLVTLMRSHGITLDYGSLAADLLAIQRPGGPERVRMQWGRDLYGVRPPTPEAPAEATPSTTDTTDDPIQES